MPSLGLGGGQYSGHSGNWRIFPGLCLATASRVTSASTGRPAKRTACAMQKGCSPLFWGGTQFNACTGRSGQLCPTPHMHPDFRLLWKTSPQSGDGLRAGRMRWSQRDAKLEEQKGASERWLQPQTPVHPPQRWNPAPRPAPPPLPHCQQGFPLQRTTCINISLNKQSQL